MPIQHFGGELAEVVLVDIVEAVGAERPAGVAIAEHIHRIDQSDVWKLRCCAAKHLPGLAMSQLHVAPLDGARLLRLGGKLRPLQAILDRMLKLGCRANDQHPPARAERRDQISQTVADDG